MSELAGLTEKIESLQRELTEYKHNDRVNDKLNSKILTDIQIKVGRIEDMANRMERIEKRLYGNGKRGLCDVHSDKISGISHTIKTLQWVITIMAPIVLSLLGYLVTRILK